jgi:hypothetical protein
MSTLEEYEVEVFVKDKPTYVVTVNSFTGPHSAVSRAVTTIWAAKHPGLPLDDIRGNIYTN